MLKRKTVCLWFLVSVVFCSSLELIRSETTNLKSPTDLQSVTLIINEYLADPPAGPSGDANGDGTTNSTQDEFVELVNNGTSPLDISGFTISDAIQIRFTIPAGRIVPPGESVVVFGGGTPTGAFGNAAANGLVFAASGAGLSLNNANDTITVKDGFGVVVDSKVYPPPDSDEDQSITRSPDITGGFVNHMAAAGSAGKRFSPGTRTNGAPFTTTDPVIDSISPDSAVVGSGTVSVTITGSNFQTASRVRVDGLPISTAFDNANQLSAELLASVTATAGAHSVTVENPGSIISNSVAFTAISAVGINEFLADPPDTIAGDANGDGTRDSSQDEFVEIMNRTGSPVDVGGFSISDADSIRFTFPPATIIPANEAAVIFGGGNPTGEFGNARANNLIFKSVLSLNNSGDTITIKDGANNIVETVIFGSAEGSANQSINRNPDGSGTSFAPHSTIAGSNGRLFSPGTRVFGEPFTVGPRINQINPDSAPLNRAPFDMSVQGSGFEPTSSVLIDSAPVNTSFANASELIARVPANVTAVAGDHRVEVRNESGNRSNVVALFIIPPPPALSAVLPRVVPVGASTFTLFIMGENFTRTSVVSVEGLTVTTIFMNARELRATLPATFAATLGTRLVKVRNSDGQESKDMPFDVVPVNTRITSLFPTQAIAGGPNFALIVRGSNFKSGATVMFDGVPLATKFISATQLQAEVPASLIAGLGLRVITAQNADGGSSNETIFEVLPNPPLIHSVDPPSVIAGAGDVVMAVTGERFQPGAVVRIIENGQSGARLDTTFINSGRVEAKLLAAFTQTASNLLFKVENPDFGFSNDATLKVLIKDPLVINEFMADPPDSFAGDANGDGSRSASQDEFVEIVNRANEPIDLSGYKLSDADEVRHVFAAGTVLPPFEATVVFGGGKPAGEFGNAAENHLVFTASTGGFSLNNGGDTIKLEDAQGRIVQEIKFDAMQGGANQSINRNPDAGGAGFSLHTIVAEDSKRLFSPGAKASGETFTIKPAIRALVPASIHAGGPTFTLTVSGVNFLQSAIVLFGQTPLATTFRSDTELETEVSADLISEGGVIELRVKNPRGELSTGAKFVIADDPPRTLKITPQQAGTGAENLELTISGERFQRGAKVMISSEAIETMFVSKTLLIARAPAKFFKAAGVLETRVMNEDGNPSNALMLSVENGPLITRLSRKRIKAGAGAVELTIGGVAFKSEIVLFVNDIPVATTFASDTSFTARIPAEMTSKPGSLTLQARHADGGRSNKLSLKIVE